MVDINRQITKTCQPDYLVYCLSLNSYPLSHDNYVRETYTNSEKKKYKAKEVAMETLTCNNCSCHWNVSPLLTLYLLLSSHWQAYTAVDCYRYFMITIILLYCNTEIISHVYFCQYFHT